MTNYQKQPVSIDNNGYIETKTSRRLTVGWDAAVITYTSKVAKYGAVVGIGVGIFWQIGMHYPQHKAQWIQAAFLVLSLALIFSGMFAAFALVIKDALFPYLRPVDTFKNLPGVGAPGNMKAAPLMGIVDGSIRYGKLKLEPAQQLALANAILRQGNDYISQRKLAEWGIVPTKEAPQAAQLKADFIWTGLGVEAGNNQVKVVPAFDEWASGLFPQLADTPLP